VQLIFEYKPSVVGHRGSGAGQADGYQENSLEAFLAAAVSGVPWVELDARRSSDGELMIWHDPATPGGDLIRTHTAAELSAAGILRLDEVLSVLPASVSVDVDVKTVIEDATDPEHQRTHVLIARALRRYRGTRRFLISSFDPSLPAYLKDRKVPDEDVALGLITEVRFSAGPAVSAAANLGMDAVCLHIDSLRDEPERVLEFAHKSGLEVMAWSPDPALAVTLAEAGVDAVCVDDIPGTQAALAGMH
jgi:glycerophosphoryl diester phosphodiesterase